MARQIKCRRVAMLPNVTYFKPMGIPVRCLNEVQLSVEEVEALRLKDYEGLEQEQGAQEMKVSRPTFQRVLASAHHKTADALLNGKSLRIHGGHFEISPKRFRCANGHEWEVPFGPETNVLPQFCPECKTVNIERLLPIESECPFIGRAPCCLKCPRAIGDKGGSEAIQS